MIEGELFSRVRINGEEVEQQKSLSKIRGTPRPQEKQTSQKVWSTTHLFPPEKKKHTHTHTSLIHMFQHPQENRNFSHPWSALRKSASKSFQTLSQESGRDSANKDAESKDERIPPLQRMTFPWQPTAGM